MKKNAINLMRCLVVVVVIGLLGCGGGEGIKYIV